MASTTFRNASLIVLSLTLPFLSGCGGDKGINITGKVTLDGQPVEFGSVSFYPDDGQGPIGAGSVEDGELTASGLTPGKKRAKLTLSAPGEAKQGNQRQRRQEIQDERRKASKGQGARTPKAVKVNDVMVEVAAGMPPITIDFKSSSGGR